MNKDDKYPARPLNPVMHEGNAASGAEATPLATSAPEKSAPIAAYDGENNAGIVSVLFTSFIIQ